MDREGRARRHGWEVAGKETREKREKEEEEEKEGLRDEGAGRKKKVKDGSMMRDRGRDAYKVSY